MSLLNDLSLALTELRRTLEAEKVEVAKLAFDLAEAFAQYIGAIATSRGRQPMATDHVHLGDHGQDQQRIAIHPMEAITRPTQARYYFRTLVVDLDPARVAGDRLDPLALMKQRLAVPLRFVPQADGYRVDLDQASVLVTPGDVTSYRAFAQEALEACRRRLAPFPTNEELAALPTKFEPN